MVRSEVIPETHYDGVLSDSEFQKRASASQGVERTVAGGGVHASSKTDSPRRVLHLEYASRSCVLPDCLRPGTTEAWRRIPKRRQVAAATKAKPRWPPEGGRYNSIGGVALEVWWTYVDVFEDTFQFVQLIFCADMF